MIGKACATAILGAILAFLLSEYGYRGKRLFSVVATVSLLSLGLELFFEALASLDVISRLAGLSEATGCAVKIVGAGYVFGISSDICREMGEAGIATALTTVGRLEIFVTVLPYILKMVELGAELIK